MHQALPYKTWQHPQIELLPFDQYQNQNHKNVLEEVSTSSAATTSATIRRKEEMKTIVLENAVIVIGKKGCCMSHVVKRLLLGLGVNPAIYEVDDREEKWIIDELKMISNSDQLVQFPAVFIGGRLFGGLERIIATHITGELTPTLRQAGALWL